MRCIRNKSAMNLICGRRLKFDRVWRQCGNSCQSRDQSGKHSGSRIVLHGSHIVCAEDRLCLFTETHELIRFAPTNKHEDTSSALNSFYSTSSLALQSGLQRICYFGHLCSTIFCVLRAMYVKWTLNEKVISLLLSAILFFHFRNYWTDLE